MQAQGDDSTLFGDIYIFEFDDIKNFPVSNLDDVLILFPGVFRYLGSFHIQGGTGENEITYYLGGIPIINPDQINLSMIDKISIQKSGFSTEYGNGFSGIVFIRTKKEKKNTAVSYLTDDIFSTDRLNYGFNQYNIHNQGSITKDIRYSISGRYLFTDDHSSGLYKVSAQENCYNGLARIDYRFRYKGIISVMGYAFRNQFMPWHPDIVGGNAYKYFDQRPMDRGNGQSIIATCEILLSNKTISSVRFIRTNLDSVFGNRDYEWEEENGYKWYDDYRLKGEHLISYLIKDNLPLRDIMVDSLIQYHKENDKNGAGTLCHNPYGIAGLFHINGDYPGWCNYNTNINQFLIQLIHEPEMARLFEIGFRMNPTHDFTFNLSLYQRYLYDFAIQKIEDYYGYYLP